MVPLLIVGLKKPYLKKMGFQEMFYAQPANLKIQGPSRGLAPSHELPLPLFTTFPGRFIPGNRASGVWSSRKFGG